MALSEGESRGLQAGPLGGCDIHFRGSSKLTGSRSGARVVSELSGCCRGESLPLEDKKENKYITSRTNQQHTGLHLSCGAQSAKNKFQTQQQCLYLEFMAELLKIIHRHNCGQELYFFSRLSHHTEGRVHLLVDERLETLVLSFVLFLLL